MNKVLYHLVTLTLHRPVKVTHRLYSTNLPHIIVNVLKFSSG